VTEARKSKGGGPARSVRALRPFWRNRMKTAKDEVREILDQVPDDATLEEIQYRIYVHQTIDRGLEDVKNGKTVSQQEMESRMARWLGK
jgi:predicted transcriptional regulator